MDYVQTATKGTTELNNLNSVETNINNISFDLIWNGSAYSALTSNLSSTLDKIAIEKQKLSAYFDALNTLEIYKQNKEKIAQLKIKLFMIPDTKKYESERASLEAQINELTAINQQLRNSIESVMASITPIGTNSDSINYAVEFDYITGVSELLNAYKLNLSDEERAAGETLLRKLADGASLADYYNQVDENGNIIEGSGLAYIESVMASIQATYSGREAAVNSALAMLKLAADTGVKLDYEHKGTNSNPYVTTADVVTGVDCNPWTSWVVDKGTPGGFQWRPVTGFYGVGENLAYEDWSSAQPGDVIVSSGHVGVIIENDPENNCFITAEASGSEIGIRMLTRTYASTQSSGFSVRDMTNVYEGTENTNRAVFDNAISV